MKQENNLHQHQLLWYMVVLYKNVLYKNVKSIKLEN